MDSSSIAADYITAANATTGFAILQNIAFSYGLLKRELPIRLDGKWQWILLATGIVWNSVYVVVIWWCTVSAIDVAGVSDKTLRSAVELLGYAKCFAAAFFGIMPVWIILIYNYEPFWQRPEATERRG